MQMLAGQQVFSTCVVTCMSLENCTIAKMNRYCNCASATNENCTFSTAFWQIMAETQFDMSIFTLLGELFVSW